MTRNNLRLGTDSNVLEILVDSIEIKSQANSREHGICIKFDMYNLDNVLCQMLDDYSEDELIQKIKALR